MRQRFWRAVFRYAAPRTGWPRYAHDRDAQMDRAYQDWAPDVQRAVDTTVRTGNVTYTYT